MVDDVVVAVIFVVRIVVLVVGDVSRGLVAFVAGLSGVLRWLVLVHGLDDGGGCGRRGGWNLARDGRLVDDVGERAEAIDDGEREGDVAIGGVGEGDHAVAARLVLGPVVPLVLQGEGAGVLEGDAVAVAESVGGIPVAERGVVTDDPDVGGGALQLELDANVRGDFHGPSAPARGLHMGVP